jgi:hypothetical protein
LQIDSAAAPALAMMKPFSPSTKRGVGPSRTSYIVLLSMLLWALIFSLHCSTGLQSGDTLKPPAFFPFRFGRPDRCAGRYIYMYDLPPRFNADLVRDCRRLSPSTDMCKHVANDGFGSRSLLVFSRWIAIGWHAQQRFLDSLSNDQRLASP